MSVTRGARWALITSDCVDAMKRMRAESVDAVVTDPPYGLGAPPPMEDVLSAWLAGERYHAKGAGFMGKEWDAFVPGPEVWREALRVLKPGGHLLAFFSSRTFDLGALAIRLAGFEVRDTLSWLYGSGFPKSLDVSKAIDASIRFGGSGSQQLRMRNGFAPGTVGTNMHTHRSRANDSKGARLVPRCACGHPGNRHDPDCDVDGCECKHWSEEPVAAAARQWDGWGTALKPAWEPIILARKPLVGTVAANVLQHGTGALNVDGCRIQRAPDDVSGWSVTGSRESENLAMSGKNYACAPKPDATGRWPANVLLDEHAAELLDAQTGTLKSGSMKVGVYAGRKSSVYSADAGRPLAQDIVGSEGGASRFFYVAKASRAERDAGCESLPARTGGEATGRENGSAGTNSPRAGAGRTGGARNTHPTVKPVELMRWLVRLVTPPGGLVLDPFTGSGSTGVAALREGFRFVGVEQSEEYIEIAHCRLTGETP